MSKFRTTHYLIQRISSDFCGLRVAECKANHSIPPVVEVHIASPFTSHSSYAQLAQCLGTVALLVNSYNFYGTI
jgi:hypothetical protein